MVIDQTVMWIIGLGLSGAVVSFGIWNTLTKEQAVHQTKIDHADREIRELKQRMKDHEDKLERLVLEIHEMVHDIRLKMIENNNKKQ